MPKPMTPTHTKLQSKTLTTLNTTLDSQSFGSSVKLSTWEAFYHTKSAVHTINHTYDRVNLLYQRDSTFHLLSDLPIATIAVGFVLSIKALNIHPRHRPWKNISRAPAGDIRRKCSLPKATPVLHQNSFGTAAAASHHAATGQAASAN